MTKFINSTQIKSTCIGLHSENRLHIKENLDFIFIVSAFNRECENIVWYKTYEILASHLINYIITRTKKMHLKISI